MSSTARKSKKKKQTKSPKMSKCFQMWFKGNLHRVSWFAWQEQRRRPINHSQAWHSYLALSYQLSQGEQKPSSQTFQSDSSRHRLEAKFSINSMTDLILWRSANQFTIRIISITTPPRLSALVRIFASPPFKCMNFKVIGNKRFVKRRSSRGQK